MRLAPVTLLRHGSPALTGNGETSSRFGRSPELGHLHMCNIRRSSVHRLLPLVIFAAMMVCAEAFFRLIEFDFAYEERAWRQVPVFYRQPTVPTGEVFFRRTGAQTWTGQVISTRMSQLGYQPNPYLDESVISVVYDDDGFRNRPGVSDWRIAVAGDSFTELGHLSDDELFTSVLASKLGVSVRNLGTSYTGPLSHLSYLRDYGVAAGTTHSIIIFFEGNDLEDLAAEYEDLRHWKETGQRPYREFKKQSSFVKAIAQLAKLVKHAATHDKEDLTTAYFKATPSDIPITLGYAPEGSPDMSKETMRRLDYFLTQYAGFGHDRQIEVWLAFMPSKLRALHGKIEFSASAAERFRNWQPTDLPDVVSALCDEHGIGFLDLTPALTTGTDIENRLLYNSMYDTHLNEAGSRVVGQELARHLSREIP